MNSKVLIMESIERDGYTRFEIARIIGARALQISLGAPVLIDIDSTKSAFEIAKIEFDNSVIPITVKRRMPKKRKYKNQNL